MLDPYKIRKDFPMFDNCPTMQGHPLVYLDNAATTFKPQCVIDAISEYYSSYTANSHRGDYDLAHKVDVKYEEARNIVAKFINAEPNEVAFTSGTSMSMNMIAYGLAELLDEGDEILLSEAEHASNVLPWFKIAEIKHCTIGYIPLTEDGRMTAENLKNSITPKTKVISLAQVTNVLGYTVDVKELAKIAHEHNALFIVDGAQSVPHMKVDVKDIDCDFLAFSGHKICGPTGIGVMYGKYELLKKISPLLSGGGMNTRFETCGNVSLQIPPLKFEAGTQNIAGAIGLARAIQYVESIGLDNIREYEAKLRKRAIDGLKKIPGIKIYNPDADSGIITFNIDGVFAQDAASLFNSYGVCVRSGQHCAKILMNFLKTTATLRASIYFYNTDEDIDAFLEACRHGGDFLDAFFK